MPTSRDHADPVQQAHAAYLTLYQALQALPADHPVTSRLAQLVAVASQHWQSLQRAEEATTTAVDAAISLHYRADSPRAVA